MQFKTLLLPATALVFLLATPAAEAQLAPCTPPTSVGCPPAPPNEVTTLSLCDTEVFPSREVPWSTFTNPNTPPTINAIQIPKWTPRPGEMDQLLQVRLLARGRIEPQTYVVANKVDDVAQAGSLTVTVTINLAAPLVPGFVPIVISPVTPAQPFNLPGTGGPGNEDTAGCGLGTSRIQFDVPLTELESLPIVLTAPAQLAAFTGAGFVTFEHSGVGSVDTGGPVPTNLCLNFTTLGGFDVEVQYVYCRTVVCDDCDNNGVCDVNDPDCDGDGLPDACEPDCDDDGIPDDCDLDPGPGCECIERHRRMPASLLLYPEYDNREGSQTLVTVTNTNCDQSQGSVDVEFVYINKQNCLENNFTVRLTPCDTYTVITRFQNPNSQRGYLYAFAKSTQTGQAISFNFLIGNLMAINGIYQFDWSVNPLVFKGVTGHRQPTDLDGDGVRDLDGDEYWEAPDRLFVPRFLGQDDYNAPCAGGNCDFVPAGFASELVLLNLSGGAQFSTIAFFQIFNDNEEPFSASWEFQCWDRVRLNRINGAFTQSFLAGLKSNDPTEIIGATHHEAGWFWFDGVSGDSSAEHIENPAIYGFLIERVRNYFAADLPWEFCSQDNGDLLPHGPFGDPRPGFPGGQLGDNQ